MSELIAAIFLLAGSFVALVAAIGVVRLPDAFLRMHASTKAGTVGSGLVLIGTALAFGEVEAWIRAAVILAFLLATTPVAANALGRAAYVGGAPLWGATVTDALAGILPRAASGPTRAASPGSDPGATPAPRRILVALAGWDAQPAALDATVRSATRLACRFGNEVTLLSLLDETSPRSLAPRPNARPTPREHPHPEDRVTAARHRAERLSAMAEAACSEAGVRWRLQHAEGDAAALLRQAAFSHDLVVAPHEWWFAHGEAPAPEGAPGQLPEDGMPPLLLVQAGAEAAPPRRVLFLHEGGEAADAALRRLLLIGLAKDATMVLTAPERPGLGAELDAAEALAAAHGHRIERARPLRPDHPPSWPEILEAAGPVDLLALEGTTAPRAAPFHQASERAIMRGLVRAPVPMLLL